MCQVFIECNDGGIPLYGATGMAAVLSRFMMERGVVHIRVDQTRANMQKALPRIGNDEEGRLPYWVGWSDSYVYFLRAVPGIGVYLDWVPRNPPTGKELRDRKAPGHWDRAWIAKSTPSVSG